MKKGTVVLNADAFYVVIARNDQGHQSMKLS